MAEWGHEPHAEDVELLVSELVSNAILHARGDVRMAIRRWGDALRVEVTDLSPQRPAPRDRLMERVNGRGLHLVELLADDWGVEELPGERPGKVVWCEVVA